MIKTQQVTAAVALLAALTACSSIKEGYDKGRGDGPSSIQIKKEDLGADWPLTVDKGNLTCIPTDPPAKGVGDVTFQRDGKTYGVNGSARDRLNLPAIDAIWAADPANPGAKKSISALLDRGLALCK